MCIFHIDLSQEYFTHILITLCIVLCFRVKVNKLCPGRKFTVLFQFFYEFFLQYSDSFCPLANFFFKFWKYFFMSYLCVLVLVHFTKTKVVNIKIV